MGSAVGTSLMAYALVTSSHLLVIGAAGVGVWLVGSQLVFLFEVSRVYQTLTVERHVDTRTVHAEERFTITTRAQMPGSTRTAISIRTPLPAVFHEAGGEFSTTFGSLRTVTLTGAVRPSVTGEFTIPPATVEVTGPSGLFSESFELGEPITLNVDPRQPDRIHIGTGGDRIAAAYGEHEAEAGNAGITPNELRLYVAGDPVKRIDWKATARQNEPYVREVEAKTDIQTIFLLDQRDTLRDGPTGQRKIDYLREVALTYLRESRRSHDLIGLFEIGNDGVLTAIEPGTTSDHYQRVDAVIRSGTSPDTEGDIGQSTYISPAEATRREKQLTDDSGYANTLGPYFADRTPYLSTVREQPLLKAVTERIQTYSERTLLIVFSDDANNTELRETLKVISQSGDEALVFLAPSAIFGSTQLREATSAYGEYLEFESFRKELSHLPRVQAFEVAPLNKMNSLLAQRNAAEAIR